MNSLAYLATLLAGALVLLLARYLREPSPGPGTAEGRAAVAGILTGLLIAASQTFGPRASLEAGVIISITSLYLRSRLRPDDFSGLITGSLAGLTAAATIVTLRMPGSLFDLIRPTQNGDIHFALPDATIVVVTLPIATLLTAAVRGRNSYRVAISVAITSSCATAFLVAYLLSLGVDPGHLTIAVLSIPPVILLASLFRQWPLVTRELRDEARLDLFPGKEVAGVAHPLRRLGCGGWSDLDARRKLISKATGLAMAKHRQRQMTEEPARLYQLEIMKLRMEIREILDIHQALLLDAEDSSRVESTSDTMSSERATPPR